VVRAVTASGDEWPELRVGQGFDVHRFGDDPTRRTVLAGCTFDDVPGLEGHSDADVVAHACADALLGAAGLGDIGEHFPDTDPEWAGADSMRLLARVRDQLRAQQMSLEVTPAAKEHIIKLGYDVAYGARPLRRVIQNMIEDVLAEHLLLGKYEPGSTIIVDKDPEAGLDIRLAEPRTPVEAR